MAGSHPNSDVRKHPPESTRRWKASWFVEAARIDVLAVGTNLVGRLHTVPRGAARGGRRQGRQRNARRPRAPAETSRRRVVNGTGVSVTRGIGPPSTGGGRLLKHDAMSAFEARLRAVKRVRAGAPGCRKAVRRRAGEVGSRRRSTPRSRWRKPRRPEVERTVGCTCRWLVAEIGEKHLPTTSRGEPRGKPRRRWVARFGGVLVTEDAHCRGRREPRLDGSGRAKRVRSGSRERNRDRILLHSIARSRIQPVEGALGSRATRS